MQRRGHGAKVVQRQLLLGRLRLHLHAASRHVVEAYGLRGVRDAERALHKVLCVVAALILLLLHLIVREHLLRWAHVALAIGLVLLLPVHAARLLCDNVVCHRFRNIVLMLQLVVELPVIN